MSALRNFGVSVLVGGLIGVGLVALGRFPDLKTLGPRFLTPATPAPVAPKPGPAVPAAPAAASSTPAPVPPPPPAAPKGPRFTSLEPAGPRPSGIYPQAATWTAGERRRRILELTRETVDEPTGANLDLRVSQLILDEDVYMLLETVIGGGSGLTAHQHKVLLLAVYRAGARYGMVDLVTSFPQELAGLRLPLTLVFIDETAGRDLFAALELLSRPEAQDQGAGELVAALYGYAAKKDSAKALALAGKMESYPLRELAERGILVDIARKEGLPAAWAHTLKIPEDGARFRLQSAIIRAVGQLDAARRGEMLAMLVDPATSPAMRNSAAGGILRHWAATEPAAAFDWAAAHLGDKARELEVREILRSVLAEYQRRQPAEAAAKLAALPPKLREYLKTENAEEPSAGLANAGDAAGPPEPEEHPAP